ncbi:MAG: hypothetical protein KGQ65_01720 [Burkholderiales bacterium]|nr:hypothetical protein [Burkholderiales bacterium]
MSDIKLDATSDVDLLDRMLQATAQIEAQDQAVINHIKIRGSNQDFRNKVKQALNTVKGRRGPKPDGLPPIAFFELIKAIKKSYKLKNNGLAFETYCELHNLPLEKASSLEDKYRRGREEKAKKIG